MKSGTIPICLKPDIMPEYMIERDEKGNPIKAVDGAGIWTENYYDLPILTGEVLIKFLDDSILPQLYETMDNVVSKYNQTDSETRLVEIYTELTIKRMELFQKALAQPATE